MEITRRGDVGTKERHARGDLAEKVVEGQIIGVVRKISPIDYYYNHDQINSIELSAGNLLYGYYVTTCIGYHDCTPKERVDGGGKAQEETEKQVHARLEYNRGMDAAKEYTKIINDIVLDEKFIAEIVTHWYTRKKMKQRLRLALNQIAICYNIKT